jgi:hypothetical protein
MRNLEAGNSPFGRFFLTDFVSGSPEDLICQWRKEAGILRILGGRCFQMQYGVGGARRRRHTLQELGTLDLELDQSGERETRKGLAAFPYEELAQAGIGKQLALAVILSVENWMRVEKYSLVEKAREELTELHLSAEVIDHLTSPLQSSRKGRRSRLASTKQDLPVRPGPAPWPAPFVSVLVLEAMLEQHGEKNPELINKIVIALGGSPDQLGRYGTRLITVQVPPPTFKRTTSPQIPIIEWLAQSFAYYPSCWTEQPQGQYYYPADSPFFRGLPKQAIRALVVTGSVSLSKEV